jgi:hypothetical protein
MNKVKVMRNIISIFIVSVLLISMNVQSVFSSQAELSDQSLTTSVALSNDVSFQSTKNLTGRL